VPRLRDRSSPGAKVTRSLSSTCDCGAGWPTFSGHRLSCPRHAVATETRLRIEREEYNDREENRRTMTRVGRAKLKPEPE
jgi:hypothetical protein